MMLLESLIFNLLPAAVGIMVLVLVFESCWRKCPPDKLMIVSGAGKMRSVSGKGTFVIPLLQRVDTISLGAVQVQPVSYTHLDVYKRQGLDALGVLLGGIQLGVGLVLALDAGGLGLLRALVEVGFRRLLCGVAVGLGLLLHGRVQLALPHVRLALGELDLLGLCGDLGLLLGRCV